MDVGQISSDSFKYSLSDPKKIFILGIITILSSLIIPGFLLLGYFLRIIKSSIAGSSEPPQFDDWVGMFTDGLKVFVVLLIYSLIPTVLILLGIWAALLPMLSVPGSGSLLNPSVSVGLVGGVALIGIGLEILVSFIIAIALGNMAYYNELGAAFRLGEITGKIREIGGVDYFIWYVVMLIIAWAAYTISFFLVFPLIIGIIIVPLLILPYFMVFFARSTALILIYGGSYDFKASPHK